MIYHLDSDSASVCISALSWQKPLYTSLKRKMKPRHRNLWKSCTTIRGDCYYAAFYWCMSWYMNHQQHREHDKPTVEDENGYKAWYKNGQRHRDNDKPAVERVNGHNVWYKNGQRHRDNDKPAVEYTNGTKYWYENDHVHREHDKPAIERANGDKEWYKNGQQYYLQT